MTKQKAYKKVYVYHEDDIIFKVLIDNILVAQKELTGTDSTTIQVPSNLQRGFFIQFEIEGTGTVHEIEYEVGQI